MDAFFVPLKNRGLIHIEGEDRVPFLQGLITQDVTKLEAQRIQYGCLLTPQGKFLHDFFLHWGDGFILLDCEGGYRAQDLYDLLNKYRLRSRVTLSVEKENPVYAVFGSENNLPDPRHFALGHRSFTQPDLPREDFDEWDKQRIILGIPDGSRDMEIEKSTVMECNLDRFHAIDWKKGCYMGQELTARMKYRNLGKKQLQVIKFNKIPPPPAFHDIEIDGKIIGSMRSSCGDMGLTLIKNEHLEELKHGASDLLRVLG